MYQIRATTRFTRDLKTLEKRGYRIERLTETLRILASGDPLPHAYRDHPLLGDYRNTRECHIAPDWLLIYQIEESTSILYLVRTGTHSDLF